MEENKQEIAGWHYHGNCKLIKQNFIRNWQPVRQYYCMEHNVLCWPSMFEWHYHWSDANNKLLN